MSHDNKETNTSIVEEMKDLGVVMDSKLKFDKHITEISRKATGVLASIKRTMTYIDRRVFIGLYKSLVNPLLETSVSVWNPYMVQSVLSPPHSVFQTNSPQLNTETPCQLLAMRHNSFAMILIFYLVLRVSLLSRPYFKGNSGLLNVEPNSVQSLIFTRAVFQVLR